MKIDVFWIWFACFWLAVGMQNFLTVKKSSFDIAYHFKTQESGRVAFGQMSVTAENTDSLSFAEAGGFIKKDLEKSLDEDVSVVVFNVNKRESARYWQPFWRKFASI
ncbi:MAG: hypothetical protein OEV73_00380 [Desulfobulbaceae bacterium]|nr:hypothetical protein [Desulfobulbaceae bacterium]